MTHDTDKWHHEPVPAGFALIAATAFSTYFIMSTVSSFVVSTVLTLVVATVIFIGWTVLVTS